MMPGNNCSRISIRPKVAAMPDRPSDDRPAPSSDETVGRQHPQRTPTRKERIPVAKPAPRRVRTPTVVETHFDDGRRDGEVIRIRRDVTIIGRAQGDILIPHDEQISGRHAEIRRSEIDGEFQFTISDLSSTNGT